MSTWQMICNITVCFILKYLHSICNICYLLSTINLYNETSSKIWKLLLWCFNLILIQIIMLTIYTLRTVQTVEIIVTWENLIETLDKCLNYDLQFLCGWPNILQGVIAQFVILRPSNNFTLHQFPFRILIQANKK